MKLKDICEFIVDCPHSTAKDEGVGHPLIRTPNIGRGRLILDGVHRVSDEVYKKRTKRGVPQTNDILFAREAPAGNFAVIKNEQGVCLGQRTVLLRPKKDIVDSDYLVYHLLTPRKQYELIGGANGATVAHVNLDTINNLPIDLPSLDEQKRIAEILTRYDDTIENCQRQIALLEEAAQRTYNEWFVDMRFPGHEQANFIDGLPEEWEHKRIGDVFSFVRGKSYTSKEINTDKGIYLINLKNINGFGGYKRGAEKLFDGTYKEVQCVEQGDVIMAVTDMTQERRLVGHVALVPKLPQKAIISMDLIKLIPFEISKIFLYYTLYYGGFGKIISPLANGVNVLHLRPESILSLEMIIPCNNIRNRFESIVNPLIQDIEVQYQKIDFLREARDILLPRLISGEITI